MRNWDHFESMANKIEEVYVFDSKQAKECLEWIKPLVGPANSITGISGKLGGGQGGRAPPAFKSGGAAPQIWKLKTGLFNF